MNKKLDITAFGSCYIDINADNYPFSPDGIPPEVELVGSNYEVVPGGSAVNFCAFSAQLGLTPAFIGMTGADIAAEQLEALLTERGVRPYLVKTPELKTGISFNMTNQTGQHILLVAGTANAALTPETVIGSLEDAVRQSTVLFLGGCFKLTAFASAFETIATMAHRHGTKIALDHARIPAGTTPGMRETIKKLVQNADYYFPSRDEFCQLWNVPSIEEGLKLLHEKAPHLLTVVKDGANGAFYWGESAVRHVPGLKLGSVTDLTGAGDSFNAGVMTALLKEQSVRNAVRYGCEVAAAKITRQPLPLLSAANNA